MKKFSIQWKITLWFVLCMLLLAAVVFGFVAVVSRSETHRHVQGALRSLVEDNAGEVEYDDGELEIDEDFTGYRNGLYCLVLSEAGEKHGGRTPNDDIAKEALADGEVRSVTLDGEDYLIYDRKVTHGNHTVWLRGIVSESSGGIAAESLDEAVLIALPILILLAAVGGYLIAGRSLRPIRVIRRTAEEIGASGDLSRRIDIDENGDELHRLAGTFNRMFDKLEDNFEAEKQFTSDASHELRTPITTILAQCEYAFENASGEEELYEVIGDIQKQGYRMSRLVESLLTFTRLEQRTEAPAFDDLDLSACVASVCREQKELPEKGITLSEEIRPGIRMKADATLITRLLENLIRNAYRYGKENGHIRVTLSESGDGVTLTVADDGIGISAEDLPKIWNRFYRPDRSRTFREGAGLGLGLAMVKQIVRIHGGTVTAESEPGQGTVFTVRFGKPDNS